MTALSSSTRPAAPHLSDPGLWRSFADADLEQAVDEAIKAKFATSGQDCLGANRFFVERPVYDAFCRAFAERTATLTVGKGIDDPDIGPLMNAAAVARQEQHVADAVANEEALKRANATEYGLVAYLHSQDPRRIYRMSRGLQFGMVAVNRTKVTGAPIPFGGMKQSGIAREGSRLGLEAFTEVKYVCRDWG